MTWRKIYKGQKFGRLTVISQATPSGEKSTKWNCRCECGNKVAVLTGSLNRGVTVSCGCKRREINLRAGSKNRIHGHTIGKVSKEYNTWKRIKDRCHNPNNINYRNYGGRGIAVAPEWLNSFEAFLAHIGTCPDPSLSIDRIDNDKGYEPGNVRWASAEVQANNRRKPTR